MSISLQDLKNAYSRISKHINKTPILNSTYLDSRLGHEILFKAEGFQKIGAFKARGACNTISWLIENNQKPKKIVANSSGNHAQAVAWAAQKFGIPATIYMPSFSSKIKIQATKAYGAEVILCETRNIADEKVKTAANETGIYWIPPFNHEQVILGQGTAVMEALLKVHCPDAVFAPCGGGGLLSGSFVATKGLSPKTKIIGAEPLNANDAAISIKDGTIHRLKETPNTLADGAMTMAVGSITFEYLKQLDDFIEITEEEIIFWTQWLSHLLKVVVEPTSALAMAAAHKWLRKQKSKKQILVLLSGSNMDFQTYQKVWARDFLNIPI